MSILSENIQTSPILTIKDTGVMVIINPYVNFPKTPGLGWPLEQSIRTYLRDTFLDTPWDRLADSSYWFEKLAGVRVLGKRITRIEIKNGLVSESRTTYKIFHMTGEDNSLEIKLNLVDPDNRSHGLLREILDTKRIWAF